MSGVVTAVTMRRPGNATGDVAALIEALRDRHGLKIPDEVASLRDLTIAVRACAPDRTDEDEQYLRDIRAGRRDADSGMGLSHSRRGPRRRVKPDDSEAARAARRAGWDAMTGKRPAST